VLSAPSTTTPRQSPTAAPTAQVRARLRLGTATATFLRREGLGVEDEECRVPVVTLWFDYEGTLVRANDERDRIFRHGQSGLEAAPRQVARERELRRVLERFGAVETECIAETVMLPWGCDADYVVRPDGDVHDFCAFAADALPALRAHGVEVELEADYPYAAVVSDSVKWVGSVRPIARDDHEEPDWFNLELGVEIDGRRVDLLPVVLGMLEDAAESEDLRSLDRAARERHALPLGGGAHVLLDRERMRTLLRVVIELYGGPAHRKARPFAFPARDACLVARAEELLASTGATVVLDDPSGALVSGRRVLRRPRRVERPEGLQAELRPYQVEGVAFLQHLRAQGMGGVLADDMGLGKTLQTIAHLCIEKQKGRLAPPALVVAPTSLAFNWARELKRFAPHLRVLGLSGPGRAAAYSKIDDSDVVITTYPIVLRDAARLAEHEFSTLIADEAQALKNVRSQVHEAVRNLRAEHVVLLTGTPLENHLGETWALFDLVEPGLLGDELRFRRWYRMPIEQARDEERLGALRELVAPRILRRLKRDVAKELPPKTELRLPVELGGKQRELYEQIRIAAHADVRRAIRTKGLSASAISVLDALTKLRQVCCDPRLVAMDSARRVSESAKLESLVELVDTQLAEGHRMLVFSQFTSMLALIAQTLSQKGLRPLVLTGKSQNRQALVDAFERGESDIFLISLKAGGTGLNLVSADTVVHYDPWWNPAATAQATDRAYRIGQSRPVFVHSMYAAGSVEERVLRLQDRKRRLLGAVLGDEPGEATKLTEEDVEELFAPLEG
jgi:superfamily II DNA or RNA helicase